MLGMMQGKGGEQFNQPVQGQQPIMGGGMGNLAALFGNAGQMPPGRPSIPPPGHSMPMPMPQITQPQRPTIAPPMARPIPAAPSVLPPKPAAAPNPFPNTLKMNPVERARHRAGGR